MAEINDHSARGHALWSASSTERNWNCPGALALTKDAPETTSEAADWGTCAHEIAEACLREGVDAETFLGRVLRGKKYEFEVDEEMADTAQVFVDYVRGIASPDWPPVPETYFSLADLQPPFDAGGTADAIVYLPEERRLEVVDLKGGRGVVVEVEGNPQLRTYALGAMLARRDLRVEKVTSTIVQPRAPHKDGRTRSETYHIADLLEWTGDLLAAMRRSKEALDNRGSVAEAAWAETYLKPGNHCKFCPAAATCPALEKRALDLAGVWFDDLDQPRLANTPSELSPEHAARVLDAADLISDWINAVRAFWHEQAESGVEIPGYVLVPKQGREKWKEGVEEKVVSIAREIGLDETAFINPGKLKTPKQIRKAAGKHAERFGDLSVVPDAGTNLVRADKTSRAPVAPAAHKFLDILD